MSEMQYVEEVKGSKWNYGKSDVRKLERSGRKVTRSRFVRLTCADDRQYAERFAKSVCQRFAANRARYRTGEFRGRKAVVMLFGNRGWVFAEPIPPKAPVVVDQGS